MLGSFRKFSSSIFAKIFLFLVAIPFIFWGMGDLFSGGNKNTIVSIKKEKVSSEEFVAFVNRYTPSGQKVNDSHIEKMLGNFIGEKLILKEAENLNIKVSEGSLAKIIKGQKNFQKNNKFSRTEYEKFLLENNLSAVLFEAEVLNQERKKQLLDFISGGIIPPKFLVNTDFDKINQKRKVRSLDLNIIFDKKFNFTDDQIKSYYDENKDLYKENFKSIKYKKLNPTNLIGNENINDLFFKKLDEIDDFIVEGKNLDFIIESYNLKPAISEIINESGIIKNTNNKSLLPDEIFKKIFDIDASDPTSLLESNDEYLIIEVISSEILQTKLNTKIKKKITAKLINKNKRKFVSELITKINNKNFNEIDFKKFAVKENLTVSEILINNKNDDTNLKKELIDQIYKYPKNNVIVATDLGLHESYLIYIDEIENTSINENSENYKTYYDVSKVKMITDIYNTYDSYLKYKYNININYQALETIKNYFK